MEKLSVTVIEWHRHYEGGLTISMRGRLYWKLPRDYDIGSPSKQVKRNAVKLKQFIQKTLKSQYGLKELLFLQIQMLS